jgi:hypothetical protein
MTINILQTVNNVSNITVTVTGMKIAAAKLIAKKSTN